MYSGVVQSGSRSWPHVGDLELADPDFFARDPVQLLLGAPAYASIVQPELRRGGPLEPIAQRTRLGWILLGAVGAEHIATTVSALQCTSQDDLSTAVRRFWEWEELPRAVLPLSRNEQECEEHFVKTHRRLPDGRYQVSLPVRPELPDLSSTRCAASRMLSLMTRRFERNGDFRTLYCDFMREYRALDHMSPAETELPAVRKRICYLPHHGVLRGSGATAKIRVVFNGSLRTTAGDSLNDFLLTGPNLLLSLPDILMRWRRHRYVFVADIEKMYRQIQIHPDDRCLQKILWKEGSQAAEYVLNTVTYGLASVPYLAIRTLHQLATDEEDRCPLGAELLRRDTYVNDILAGAATLESGCRRRE